MRLKYLPAILLLPLAACGLSGTDNEDLQEETVSTADSGPGYDTMGDDNFADTMASDDARYMDASDGDAFTDDIPDSQERPIMQAQVVLDRRGFGPGVIDGKMGMSTENALKGFQEANDLDVTGEMDEATEEALAEWSRIPATRVVTIPASWGDAEYEDIPEDTAAKAEMDRLGYKSIDERLAERFHTTVEVLQELNPNGRPAGVSADGNAAGNANDNEPATGQRNRPAATSTAMPTPTPTGTASAATSNGEDSSETASIFRAGQQIRVPNIGGDRIAPGTVEDASWQQTMAALGVGTEQPQVDRVVVSKSASTLKAYNGDELVAMFTVSSGSSQFPLPLGEWDILAKAYNPPYSYDPEVLGIDDGDGKTYQLPPGPNSPVGVVWIDLSKEHYGIHGTPDPETIGRAQSSGCVRLTNWDAARLSAMVDTDTQVIFES